MSPLAGASFDEGVPVPMQGLVVDSAYEDSLDSLTATWAVNGGLVCDGASFDPGGTTTCDHAFSAGPATIALSATDPEGQTATVTIEVTVNDNDAPSATIVRPEETGTFYSNTPISFEGLVGDTEDAADQLSVTWDSSADGILDIDGSPTSSGQVSGSATLTQGNHYITLTVTDTAGRTGEDTASILVNGPNNVPTCGITAPESGYTSAAGQTILFEGTATDTEIPANLLSATWTSDKDGVIATSTPSSAGDFFTAVSSLSINTHTITLDVVDEVGALCNDAILVQIGNAPFVVLDLPTSGSTVNTGDAVAFQATLSDVEDSATALGVVWESDIDGVLSTQGANSSGITAFSSDDLSSGSHNITITATDSDGFIGLDRSTVYVNGVPTAPTVEITPDPAGSGDTLVASILTDSVDPEGDPITYIYEWYQNGVLTAYATSTINSTVHARGEIWEVRVYGWDRYGYSPPGTDSITIGNGAPTASSVTIAPATAYTNDTLSAVVSGWSDPDGDTEAYLYQWYLNGSAISGATDATLSGAYFIRGDTMNVTATPWDGTNAGTLLTSGDRVISNSVPTTPTVGISPTLPEDDDSFTCSISVASTDDDGDTVSYTYAWTVNGTASAITSQTVDASDTTNLDVWLCSVTPSDGTDLGTPATASVTVDDHTAPDCPTLSSISPYRNEDTVTISGGAEAGSTVILYIQNSAGTSTQSTTASGAATFSFSLTGLTRGDGYSFYATATDDRGNVSSSCNTLTTEACDPWDVYEDGTGYGDTCADPIVDWAALDDGGGTAINIVGNILDSSDTEDWYLVETSDALSVGINYYRFHITMQDGTSDYRFTVYEGGCADAYLDCSSAGYTEYEYYAEDVNDSGHGLPTDTRYCNYGTYAYYNNCDDLSSDYYIKVTRTSSAYDCTNYELEISNGIW